MKVLGVALAIALVATATADAQVFSTRKGGPSGYLGINFGETVKRNGNGSREQIKVNGVMNGSPAQKAGVKTGDEILRVNGMVATNGKFRALAATLAEGDTVRLRIRRDGKELDLTVVAAARPAQLKAITREFVFAPDSIRKLMLRYLDSARVHFDSLRLPNIRVIPGDSDLDVRIFGRMPGDTFFFKRDSFGKLSRPLPPLPGAVWERQLGDDFGPGMVFHSIDLGRRAVGGAEFMRINDALSEYFKVDHGLLAVHVLPETPADRAGLRDGDVVLKAKDHMIDDVSDLRSIVAANPDGVKLEILRKGRTQSITFKTRR